MTSKIFSIGGMNARSSLCFLLAIRVVLLSFEFLIVCPGSCGVTSGCKDINILDRAVLLAVHILFEFALSQCAQPSDSCGQLNGYHCDAVGFGVRSCCKFCAFSGSGIVG